MNPDNLNFGIETLRGLLGVGAEFNYAKDAQFWCIKNPQGLAQTMGKLGKRPLLIMDPSGELAVTEVHQYKAEGTLNYLNCSIHIITGSYEIDEEIYVNLIIVFGSSAFCASIQSLIIAKVPGIATVTDTAALASHGKLTPVTNIPAIATEEIVGYVLDGNRLSTFLVDHRVSLNTRVLTAIVSLYTYTVPLLEKSFNIMLAPPELREDGGASAMDYLTSSGDNTGETLALLCLMILGKAYSRADKIAGQIAKRAKAIGVVLKSTQPTEATVSSVISTAMWKTESLSNTLDDALAACICIKDNLTYDCEAEIGTLMTTEALEQANLVGRIGSLILTQARLVYSNFHSSSIHFILPMLPQLISVIGDTNQIFRPEIEKFRTVEDTLRNAPYLGLRSSLPEKFHIKNFPLLTYCAVNYHKTHLTNQADKEAFALYVLSDIKVHLSDPSYLATADSLIQTMTSPTVASLADLVRVLPLAKAQSIMMSKDPNTQTMVMDQLRHSGNPGAWAEDIIQRENAEYQRRAMAEGVGHIEKVLDKKYRLRQDALRDIADPDARAAERASLDRWTEDIRQQLMDLTPLASLLPDAPRSTQDHLKATIVENLTAILNQITQPPHHDRMES